ncbi:response regulator transcription factor [Sphingomonas crocodyli]|uniref:Response regulator n=1 Tax=Sphingomonas crocodyli TaxID=1979270 RepID=A0A437M023_9SPHN|nr:response regulator [Sphingomonas crocodyli]RVT90926.1 response regulator [Sphingomonas crocodyli]
MSRVPAVAIVDDDEAIREALEDLMVVEGFDCQAFDGAAAFLADYDRTHFDCLITDVRMPGMSGIELLEYLRSLGSRLPVIVLTSVIDEQSRARSLALGAKAWLTKPAAENVLLGELRRAI